MRESPFLQDGKRLATHWDLRYRWPSSKKCDFRLVRVRRRWAGGWKRAFTWCDAGFLTTDENGGACWNADHDNDPLDLRWWRAFDMHDAEHVAEEWPGVEGESGLA